MLSDGLNESMKTTISEVNPAAVSLTTLGRVVLAAILFTALLFFILKIIFDFRKMHYQ